MVCLGNICRSPMADAIMLDLLNKNKLSDKIIIDSAGTEYYHIGKTADERAIRTCFKHGIDLNYHRARKINENDAVEKSTRLFFPW